MADRPTEEAASGTVRYRWYESFLDRNYRLLAGSNVLNYLCNGMEIVVLGWLILDMTGSVWNVTVGAFLRFGPALPMSLVAGTLADRFDRRKILLWNQLGSIATTGMMAALLLTGSIELWQIFALAPLRGVFNAVQQPLRRALVMDLMGQERITNALSLDAAVMMLANILGPIASGRLIDTLGPASSYIAMVSFYTAGMIFLVILRTRGNVSSSRGESILKNMVGGLRYALTHPVILPTLAITFLANLLGFPFRQVFPVFAKDIYNVDATGLGLMGSVIGVGALIGALMLAGLGTRSLKSRSYIGGSLLMAVTTLFFSFSGIFQVSLLILLIHGFGFAGFHIMQGTIPLSVATEDMRGRVMGVTQLAIGGGPLGTLIVGGLATALGAPVAVGIMASVFTVSILVILVIAPKLRTV